MYYWAGSQLLMWFSSCNAENSLNCTRGGVQGNPRPANEYTFNYRDSVAWNQLSLYIKHPLPPNIVKLVEKPHVSPYDSHSNIFISRRSRWYTAVVLGHLPFFFFHLTLFENAICPISTNLGAKTVDPSLLYTEEINRSRSCMGYYGKNIFMDISFLEFNAVITKNGQRNSWPKQ